MVERFDAYHVWLGIPPEEQPPNHYRLLGIALFESDPDVIANAGARQMAHVKASAMGPHGPESQHLLNKLAFAQICLLDKERKAQYDATLQALLAGRSEKHLPKIPAPPVPVEPPPLPPAAAAPPRTWVVGRSPACDFVVAHAHVSERHCRITQEDDYTYLEDLESAQGTFVNGKRLTAPMPICRADKILVADAALLPWPPQIPVVNERLIRIGAGPDNDVVLDFPMISWRHAVIRVTNSPAVLEDLDSTNGTSLRTRANKIKKSRIMAKDTVFFGSYEVPVAGLFATIREIMGKR
jgi:pSer/pThr/pTyr-binding forkhead associated (FHA) protein